MSTPARIAAAAAAVGALSALVVWLVVPDTRLVISLAPALLVLLVAAVVVAGAGAAAWLAHRRTLLLAEGDRRVAEATDAVEARLSAERARLLGRIDHELKNPVMATNLALDAWRAAPATARPPPRRSRPSAPSPPGSAPC